MQNRIISSALLALVAAFVVLTPAEPVYAMTAQQYFDDGNRLFRDDLYWAALLRFSQAQEEGLDTPLLHYNMGVAHYRAQQHIRARESLLRALIDPSLRVASHYNLGLNAYALGDTEEALRWFRLARDQNENEDLQKFAVVAISRIRIGQEQPDEDEQRVVEQEKKREFADLELRAKIGYGSDDNIFRSPDEPYLDLSDPDAPVIVIPEVQSGAFVPVSLSAKYMINSLPFEGFYGAYRLAGRYYVDEELENGNEYLHEASFGSEYHRKTEERERFVHSAFKVAHHDEVYFDPDDGGSRIVDGVLVDDRMNYLRYGPEFSARQAGEKLSMGMKVKGQLWNYEDIEELPAYDHEYYLVSLFGQYKFTRTSLLRITTDYYSRRYGDRPAFDLDGTQGIDNPKLRYDYLSLGLRARQRITSNMWFGFDVERTERTDKHVGYNDYTRDSFSFEFHWSPGKRFDFEMEGTYNLYDFPNAFAFHNPAAGRKTQESLIARVLASYRITRGLSIFAEGRLKETVSNDIRIQYDRTQYVLGVRWEQ